MKGLAEILTDNARSTCHVEVIGLRLAIEVNAVKISPDERRQIGRLAAEAVSRALGRRTWFIRAGLKETV